MGNHQEKRRKAELNIKELNSKTLKINERSDVIEFQMKEKHVVSTRRFYEVVAGDSVFKLNELSQVPLNDDEHKKETISGALVYQGAEFNPISCSWFKRTLFSLLFSNASQTEGVAT